MVAGVIFGVIFVLLLAAVIGLPLASSRRMTRSLRDRFRERGIDLDEIEEAGLRGPHLSTKAPDSPSTDQPWTM